MTRLLDVRRLGRCDYEATACLQEDLVARRRAGEISDTLLLLEHDPVVTLGRTSQERAVHGHNQLPVVETPRGGQATYHGPGQLVAYPILDLRDHRRDLHWYLRSLEQVVITALAEFRLEARNIEGFTGVWIGERKVCSIGVAVRGWVTYHGLALNVDCDMSGFSMISPCGLTAEDMGRIVDYVPGATVSDVLPVVEQAFRRNFGYGIV
ncbi:MAG: lipoyl(octanoyl) transferase LipB [Armatimonadia bacterium]